MKNFAQTKNKNKNKCIGIVFKSRVYYCAITLPKSAVHICADQDNAGSESRLSLCVGSHVF